MPGKHQGRATSLKVYVPGQRVVHPKHILCLWHVELPSLGQGRGENARPNARVRVPGEHVMYMAVTCGARGSCMAGCINIALKTQVGR